MAHVVGWAGECADDDVVSDKQNQAAQLCLDHRTRQAELAEVKAPDQRSGESEDGPGGSHTWLMGMKSCAGKSSCERANEVNSSKGRRPIKGLAECAEVPQTPHVECDVQEASMQEAVAE